jgi:acyl carrier protein
MHIDTRLIKLIEFVKKDVAKGKGLGELSETDDLVAAEVMDSLDVMKLLLFLEEEFGIKVTDKDLTMDNLRTIESIYNFAVKKAKEQGGNDYVALGLPANRSRRSSMNSPRLPSAPNRNNSILPSGRCQ